MTIFDYPYGATKLDPDEVLDLIPQHINSKTDLNEYEQENILSAESWYDQKTFRYTDILDIDFINKVHYKMFNQTWKWAGKFRKTEKNIGIDPCKISVELKKLLDDVKFQIQHKTYSPEESAIRFHHRLVSIHLYSNGNGRHARLVTDLLLISQRKMRFHWGNPLKPEHNDSEIREKYINALRAADKGDYKPLLEFTL